MKRFAVSSTFHMIDEISLDGTTLDVVWAKNANEAAFKIIFEELLGIDKDTREEIRAKRDEPNADCGLTEDVVNLSIERFIVAREKYWRKKWKKSKKSYDRYDFYFDDQDGPSGGVYGLMVKEIK